MLQQTPVSRVLPAHAAWLARWPEPAALAAATPADAVRQWDRLGYPRRAVRLHASAQLMVARHGGQVPDSVTDLRALPGIGSYTAAAVASFAFGQRHAVLDTNVRRVLARLVSGQGQPRAAQSAAEVALAESLLPADGGGRPLVGRRDGTRRAGLHGRRARAAAGVRWRISAPGCGSGRPARSRAGRRPPTRAATGSAGARCWRSCEPRAGRCRRPRWPRPGTTQGSERVRSLP